VPPLRTVAKLTQFLRDFYARAPVLTRFLRPEAQIVAMTGLILIALWLAYVATLWLVLILRDRLQ
jgi:hypothetical protein